MIKVKIRETGFFNRCGDKRLALLEKGQTLTIVGELYPIPSSDNDDKFICSVVNPSDACKNHGGYEGMTIEAYDEDLDLQNRRYTI